MTEQAIARFCYPEEPAEKKVMVLPQQMSYCLSSYLNAQGSAIT